MKESCWKYLQISKEYKNIDSDRIYGRNSKNIEPQKQTTFKTNLNKLNRIASNVAQASERILENVKKSRKVRTNELISSWEAEQEETEAI